jgi:hypothetical protein
VLIVYERDTEKIVGSCVSVFDGSDWREATVEELFRHRDTSNLAGLIIDADPRYNMYGPDAFHFVHDEHGAVVGIEHNPPVRLSCDLPDADGDGRPELLADGQSVATITATLAEPKAGVEVSFDVNRGLLSHKTATTDETGSATVRLRSIAETVLVRVTANAEDHRATELRLELVPPPF